MMTLRILKKRSKQARDILIAHYRGFSAERFFLAERGENYHGFKIRCDHLRKPGRYTCECHYHPLPGTPMTGEVSGYYEPEWSERTALEDLQFQVTWEARPATMTDRAWRRTLAVAGTTPVTDAEIAALFADDEADANRPVCEAVA